jgi:hypothetical protein
MKARAEREDADAEDAKHIGEGAREDICIDTA